MHRYQVSTQINLGLKRIESFKKEDAIKHALKYRNPETITKEEIMEDFIMFAEDELEISQENLLNLQSLIDKYLGYDIKKAEAGELELLARWNQSVKGE